MRTKAVATLRGLAVLAGLFVIGAASPSYGQGAERPERNESGSIAPERVREREPRMPSDPTPFIEREAGRLSPGRRPAIASRGNANTAAVAATVESIPESMVNLYRAEARRFAERKRLLYADEFLKAYLLARHPSIATGGVEANLRNLLDNRLLRNRSYERILQESFRLPAQEARDAVRSVNRQLR